MGTNHVVSNVADGAQDVTFIEVSADPLDGEGDGAVIGEEEVCIPAGNYFSHVADPGGQVGNLAGGGDGNQRSGGGYGGM